MQVLQCIWPYLVFRRPIVRCLSAVAQADPVNNALIQAECCY